MPGLDTDVSVDALADDKPTSDDVIIPSSIPVVDPSATEAISEPDHGSIDTEILENDARLKREHEGREANVLADKGLIVNRGGFSENRETTKTSQQKRGDEKALAHMLQLRQQDAVSFKLDGVEVHISKSDFKSHLERYRKEDVAKANAYKRQGDKKGYDQMMKQIEATDQLLRDLDQNKQVNTDFLSSVIGRDPSRRADILGNEVLDVNKVYGGKMKGSSVFKDEEWPAESLTSYSKNVSDSPSNVTVKETFNAKSIGNSESLPADKPEPTTPKTATSISQKPSIAPNGLF